LILASAAVFVSASLYWLVPMSRTGQAAPVPSEDAPFKGKVLLVYTNGMMPVYLLEKAQVQKMGDHSWLTGKGAGDGRMVSPYKDRTVRLQMAHIVSITEYDDLKDAKKALESGIGFGGYSAVPATTPADAPPLPPRKEP
jgi:hypothetical protein